MKGLDKIYIYIYVLIVDLDEISRAHPHTGHTALDRTLRLTLQQQNARINESCSTVTASQVPQCAATSARDVACLMCAKPMAISSLNPHAQPNPNRRSRIGDRESTETLWGEVGCASPHNEARPSACRHGAKATREVDWWDRTRAVNNTDHHTGVGVKVIVR